MSAKDLRARNQWFVLTFANFLPRDAGCCSDTIAGYFLKRIDVKWREAAPMLWKAVNDKDLDERNTHVLLRWKAIDLKYVRTGRGHQDVM